MAYLYINYKLFNINLYKSINIISVMGRFVYFNTHFAEKALVLELEI